MIARENFHIRAVGAVIVNVIQRTDTVFQSDRKVFCAVVRRGVNKTSTGVGGDVIAENNWHLPLIEWMLHQQIFQRRAFHATYYL